MTHRGRRHRPALRRAPGRERPRDLRRHVLGRRRGRRRARTGPTWRWRDGDVTYSLATEQPDASGGRSVGPRL